MNTIKRKFLVLALSLLGVLALGSVIDINNAYAHVKYEREYGGKYVAVYNNGKGPAAGYGYGPAPVNKSRAKKLNNRYSTYSHHISKARQWYLNHTYRNRVHYASSNDISSHHYQPAFTDTDIDNDSIGVTNNYHSLIKGINNTITYKISKMIKATSPFQAKYLKYISGNYNANDVDVYAIIYRGHKYYYADDMDIKGNTDPLQGYNASYDKGEIDSWVKPYNSRALLRHGQHLHKNVEWDYENPYSENSDYYKYRNGHWHEESISDDAPYYV